MKVEYLMDEGRYLLVGEDGQRMTVSERDLSEIVKDVAKRDTMFNLKADLEDCSYIEGVDVRDILENEAFLNVVIDGLVSGYFGDEYDANNRRNALSHYLTEYRDEFYGEDIDDLVEKAGRRSGPQVFPYSAIANEIALRGDGCDFRTLEKYGNFPTLAEIRRDYDELMELIKDVRTPEQAKALADKTGMVVEVNGEPVDDFLNDPFYEGVGVDWIRYEAFGCLQYVYDSFVAEPMFDVWGNAAYGEFIRDVRMDDLTPEVYEKAVENEVKRLVEMGYADGNEVERMMGEAMQQGAAKPELGKRSSELGMV